MRKWRSPQPLRTYKVLRKVGSIYHEARAIWHCVEVVEGAHPFNTPAMCSTRPAMHWSKEEGEKPTCPKCIRMLNARADRALKAEIV